MSATTATVPHPPEAVFALLADGWRYAEWVVGSKRIRGVDEGWPAVGTRFHHTVGVGPIEIDDNSEVEAVDAPSCIRLKVRAWPVGSARVTITVRPAAGGSEVELDEVPVHGPFKTLDSPLLRALTVARNRESLRRLSRALERQPSS